MKISLSILIVFILVFVREPIQAQQLKLEAEGDLIWSDEFDGSGEPDAAKWERQEYNRRNNDNGPDGWWSKDDSYLDGEGNLVIRKSMYFLSMAKRPGGQKAAASAINPVMLR